MNPEFFDLRDGRIAAYRFGPVSESGPATIVHLHANGFNGLAYRHIFEQINAPSLIVDMRGHGASELPTFDDLPNWHIFRDDAVELITRHVSGPIVLTGHSFGAVSGILAAEKLKDRLVGYVGLDPVTVPGYFRFASGFLRSRQNMKKSIPIARHAGRRKSVFDSREAAFKRYHQRGAFKGMPDVILRDYLTAGLVERDGAFHLACDPKWEQNIFVAQNHNLFRTAPNLPDNSIIQYAGGNPPVSMPRLRWALKRKQPNMDVRMDKTLGHLFPFIQTDVAVGLIREVLGGI